MNGVTKTLLAVVVAALVGCTPASESPSNEALNSATGSEPMLADSSRNCTLTLGFESWEPYQYTSVRGEVGGVDIEIAKRAAAHIGCVVKAQQGSWRDLLEGLQTGKIDFVMGASLTPARLEYAYFSIPYRQEQFSLFVRRSDLRRHNVSSIEEFMSQGNRLGIVNEYYYGEDMQELMYESEYSTQFVGARLNELNMARLLDNDIDGFLEDNLVAASIIRRRGISDLISRHPVGLVPSDVYVMFSQSAVTELEVDEFNQALQELIDNGFIHDLITRYGG